MAYNALVQSVLRGIDILELVARSERGLSLQELSEAIGGLWRNPEKQAILTAASPRLDFNL